MHALVSLVESRNDTVNTCLYCCTCTSVCKQEARGPDTNPASCFIAYLHWNLYHRSPSNIALPDYLTQGLDPSWDHLVMEYLDTPTMLFDKYVHS